MCPKQYETTPSRRQSLPLLPRFPPINNFRNRPPKIHDNKHNNQTPRTKKEPRERLINARLTLNPILIKPPSLPPPLPPPPILRFLCPEMTPSIKMIQRIPPNKRLPILRISMFSPSASASPEPRPHPSTSRGTLRLSPRSTVPTLFVETRRRTMEWRAPLAQPAGRSRPGIAAVAAHRVLVAVALAWGGVLRDVEPVVAVVDCAL